MHLDLYINKKIFVPISLFFIGALIAFWPGYFSSIQQQNLYNHAHGISMTLWLLSMIIQPLLIKFNVRPIHKLVGKISYVLVPFILISIIRLYKHNSQGMPVGVDIYYSFSALVILSAAAFAILYALAIWYRKDSTIHSRYMICTLFPIITPVTDRLIGRNIPYLVQQAPTISNSPILPFYGFLLADFILIALIIWDRKNKKTNHVFPIALVITFLFQLSVFTLYKFEWWRSFTHWVLNF